MNDFRDMASKAKANHKARMKEYEDAANADKQSRDRAAAAAIAVLKREVMPLLERAKAAFRESGVDSKIDTEFDLTRSANPAPCIGFACIGPQRADGYRFQAPASLFWCEGDLIKVGVARETYEKPRERPIGESRAGKSQNLITKAIAQVLEGYYQELEKHRRNGTL